VEAGWPYLGEHLDDSPTQIVHRVLIDLETALHARSPFWTSFWTSWNLHRHLADVCHYAIKARGGDVRADTRPWVEELRWAAEKLAAYAHEVELTKNEVRLVAVQEAPLDAPEDATLPRPTVALPPSQTRQKNSSAPPRSSTRSPSGPYFRKKNDQLENTRELVKQMRAEGDSQIDMCRQLGNHPRPPHAAWRALPWPQAYRQYQAAVKKWLSSCK